MKSSVNNTLEICQHRYDDLIDFHRSNDAAEVFVSHIGEFTQDYVNQVSAEIEERMFEDGEKKGLVKKVFSIIVEGLQNIRIHGEKDSEDVQSSFFMILKNDEKFFIYLGNLIKNETVAKIKERVSQVNALEKAEIKELYLQVLTNGVISSKGGAGLGFITMSMKSGNQLVCNFQEAEEGLSLYDLKIEIDK